MNAYQTYPATLLDQTLEQLIELTAGLIQDALEIVSISRTLKQRTSEGSFSLPLVRDLVLSSVLRVMAVQRQLLFLMETNVLESGLVLRKIGQSYTNGSTLVMELANEAAHLAFWLETLDELCDQCVAGMVKNATN